MWLAGLMFAHLAGPTRLAAEEARPLVGLGASKEEVIDAYGWPSGQSRAGAREILSYPQGQVTLENGRVEKVDFSTDKPWPAPRPRPAPTAPTAPPTEPPNIDSPLTTPVGAAAGAVANPATPPPRESPPPAPPPVAEPAPTTASTPVVAAPATQARPDPRLEQWWRSSRRLVFAGLGTGVVLAALLYMLVWKKRRRPADPAQATAIARRISDAAGGLPSPADITGWPKDRLRAVVAGLAECDGYAVAFRPDGSDADLVLTRPGAAASRVLVCCAPGAAGEVAAKPLRELFATLTAEGAELGWYVAPGGFSAAARAYADAHRLRLFDAAAVTAQLRDLPPLDVPRVLIRADH